MNSVVLDKLRSINAVMNGHFLLSSGLHSDGYVQCARIIENPSMLSDMCSELVAIISPLLKSKINCIASPALGAVVFGYEVAKILGIKFLFCERVNGEMVLRRNFDKLSSESNILIVEDVITTGKSSIEVSHCLKKTGAVVSGFASIINRSEKSSLDNLPLISLIEFAASVYQESEIPLSLASIPISTPGSRFINQKIK